MTPCSRCRPTGALPVHPTFFEATTAVAFEIFRRAAVDIAVCEVGLGGRLDATNVLLPRVTAITSIGLDHEQYLGTTLAAVAAEKAGIIKPEVPVVVGHLGPEARTVIARIAGEQRAPIVDASDGVSIEAHQINDDGTQTMRLRTPSKRLWPRHAGAGRGAPSQQCRRCRATRRSAR